MTIKEKYENENKWKQKVILMNFYHKMMVLKRKKNWTIKATARYFGVSMGLVSENLKLAKQLDDVDGCKNRKDALLKLNKRYGE